MKTVCLGGGPAGLYFAISLKVRQPDWPVTVIERNRADDTFGWGVVLSDETLDNLALNDAESAATIRDHFAYWDDIKVIKDITEITSTGHGFCGLGRKTMLLLLQDRARALGVDLQFETEVEDIDALRRDYDLVVAADGVNSRARTRYADAFKPEIDRRACKFVWLGTRAKFDDAFTFIFKNTPHGWVWAHAYQFDSDTATFIVECSAATWTAHGFDTMDQDQMIAACEAIFADHLDGQPLMSNAKHRRGSAWINFDRVLCETWHHENVVLLGDASATAHFSIGSGTKLALESAIALAALVSKEPTLKTAFRKYQDERRLDVLRLQSAARNSTEWFEDVERYLDLDAVQFNYALLTRSQRISHENSAPARPRLAAKRRGVVSGSGWQQRRPPCADVRPVPAARHAPCEPHRRVAHGTVQGRRRLPDRLALCPLRRTRQGRCGLVYTEMTCVAADGRITPGCPGLYAPGHEEAWARLARFVHAETDAKLCMQIGHAGRKGSTHLGWDTMDAPLPAGNWPLLSASAVAWSDANAVPRAMDRADMDRVRDAFVAATQMADRAGFDMVELHGAHGYLISSFISPVSNHRTDAYGGSLENRMRYPLEVFAAMRAVWPAEKPMAVRISATDWVGADGIAGPDAVEVARLFHDAGVDIVDVSAGQTSTAAKPVYGRMFQTPYSDRIRNALGIPTMAVGNIYEPDHVNSILMAGRADLVCLARPHLADPYWTLHAAAALGDTDTPWPLPYLPGRDQMRRLAERADPAGTRA